jgi:head-tail adaptor
MDYGVLSKQVRIERPVDQGTPPVRTWALVTTAAASVRRLVDVPPIRTEDDIHRPTTRVCVRYRTGLTSSMRAIYLGHALYFVSLRNVDEQNREIEILTNNLTADLRDAGADLTITRKVTGAYDPVAGTTGPGSTVTVTVSAIAVTPSDSDLLSFRTNGWKIDRAVALLVAADALGSFAPKPGDTLLWNGRTYAVRDIKPLGSSWIPMAYRLVGEQ